MSRIGKQAINLNTAVLEVRGDVVGVRGPKGELTVPLGNEFVLEIVDKTVRILPKKPQFSKPKWGLYRSLLYNAVLGVERGFEKKLEMVGVGYRAQKSGNSITLFAGYSHPVSFEVPKGVEVVVEDNTKLIVRGIDKHLVGHVAAQLRKVRKPEPYKGKGIKYVDEEVRRKPGKSGKAGPL